MTWRRGGTDAELPDCAHIVVGLQNLDTRPVCPAAETTSTHEHPSPLPIGPCAEHQTREPFDRVHQPHPPSVYGMCWKRGSQMETSLLSGRPWWGKLF